MMKFKKKQFYIKLLNAYIYDCCNMFSHVQITTKLIITGMYIKKLNHMCVIFKYFVSFIMYNDPLALKQSTCISFIFITGKNVFYNKLLRNMKKIACE